MSYTLVAIFLATGQAYVERHGLSLQGCAGQAAMARQRAAELQPIIGDVRFICIPGRVEVRS